MIVNLIVIFFVLIAGFFYTQGASAYANSDKNRKSYIKLICIILILQSGLRNVAVGADTYSYFRGFENIKRTSWKQIWIAITDYYTYGVGKDPGFLAFQKIVQIFIQENQIFLFVIAIIFFSALGNFIYKNTNKLSDAIFAFVLYSSLFYYFFSITGHRQTLATAGTLFAYEFIKKRKLIPFLLIILLASTIHKSCLIFLPFYFIANIKSTRFIYVTTILFFPVLIAYKDELNNFLKKAGGYDQYDYFEGAGAYTFTAILLIVAIVAWWRMRYVLKISYQTKPFYNAFALAIFLTPLTFINQSSMRAVQYFSIFLLVLIPMVIESFQFLSIKIKQIVYGSAIILLLLLSVRSSWKSEYKFFWQKMELGENYKNYKD